MRPSRLNAGSDRGGPDAIQSAAMDDDGGVRDFLDRLHAGVERRLRRRAHRRAAHGRRADRARLGLVDEEVGRVEGEGVSGERTRRRGVLGGAEAGEGPDGAEDVGRQ